MIPIEEAKNIIQKHSTNETEAVKTEIALGRTLARAVISSVPIPPFHKSAMDGYACKNSDLSKSLECVATVNAGSQFEGAIKQGQCVKIMTGAPVPIGADTVFMYEDAEVLEDGKVKCLNENTKRNICNKGEDISIGQEIIAGNTYLEAHHIAILASVGTASVEVYKMARVGIIATGTELVEANEDALPWQIRNSNSPLFQNLVTHAVYYGIVKDEEEMMQKRIEKAYSEVDVLLITGGASDSEFDLVPPIIKKLGFKTAIRKVEMMPGKPFTFAFNEQGKYCFGLSGNPVSAYVQYIQFVHEFLRGKPSLTIESVLLDNFSRKKAKRDLFVPVTITSNGIKLISYNGSAHIAAFARAQGLMYVPKGIHSIDKGSKAHVRLL